MAYDWHVEALIQEAQEAARRPMSLKDLKPHERAMFRSINRVVDKNSLTDEEMVGGMKNLLAYLEFKRKRQKDPNGGD